MNDIMITDGFIIILKKFREVGVINIHKLYSAFNDLNFNST